MNERLQLTDAAIRSALTPAGGLRAPADLAGSVRAAVAATPQVRAGRWPWSGSPRATLALRLALLALLALAAVGAALLVGSGREPAVPPAPPAVTTFHGGPGRTGVMPGPGPVAPVGVAWSADLSGPVGAFSPVVAKGMVYVGDQGGTVWAFDAGTGGLVWHQQVGAALNGGLTIAHGLVLAGSDDGTLTALDVATGRISWRSKLDGPVHSTPVADETDVDVGTTAGTLYRLDPATGTRTWQQAVGGKISRALAFAGGLVYAGVGGATPADPGTLQAWDVRTQQLAWSRPLDAGQVSTPIVDAGRVFATTGLDGGATHHVAAFDAVTGTPAWRVTPAPGPQATLLIATAARDTLFVAATDGNLYRLDEATGASIGPPVPIGSTQMPNGAFVDGVLYVTSDDRTVRAFDAATMAVTWTQALTAVPGAPAVIDGRLFVGTALGKVVCITGATTTAVPGGQPAASGP